MTWFRKSRKNRLDKLNLSKVATIKICFAFLVFPPSFSFIAPCCSPNSWSWSFKRIFMLILFFFSILMTWSHRPEKKFNYRKARSTKNNLKTNFFLEKKKRKRMEKHDQGLVCGQSLDSIHCNLNVFINWCYLIDEAHRISKNTKWENRIR